MTGRCNHWQYSQTFYLFLVEIWVMLQLVRTNAPPDRAMGVQRASTVPAGRLRPGAGLLERAFPAGHGAEAGRPGRRHLVPPLLLHALGRGGGQGDRLRDGLRGRQLRPGRGEGDPAHRGFRRLRNAALAGRLGSGPGPVPVLLRLDGDRRHHPGCAQGPAPPGARRAGRHLPRQDHQMERRPDRRAQPRPRAARPRRSCRSTARTPPARTTCSPSTCRACPRPGRTARARARWSGGREGGKNAAGIAGVAKAIKETPGAIGCSNTFTARAQELVTVQLRNRAGSFVKPDIASFSAAAAAAEWTPPGRGRRGGRRARHVLPGTRKPAARIQSCGARRRSARVDHAAPRPSTAPRRRSAWSD